MTATPNYWEMDDSQLAAEWREVFATDYTEDADGGKAERFNFVEDAILQRIGAPEHANSDDAEWLAELHKFASVNPA